MSDETIESQAAANDIPDNADELAALGAHAADLEPEAASSEADNPEAGEPDGPSSAESLQMLMGPAFATLAPRWGVTQQEIEVLAGAWGDLANKYMPGGLSVGVELNAAIVTLAIIGARLGTPRNDAAAAKIEAKKRQRTGQREQADAAQRAAEKPDAVNDPVFDLEAAEQAASGATEIRGAEA